MRPTATPTPTPTGTITTWTTPVKISDQAFQRLSMAVDDAGFVHVAATLGENAPGRLYYLTNKSGVWTTTVAAAPLDGSTSYTEPSLAVDTDGSVWIAFVREACSAYECTTHEVGYVTNVGGQWSDPVSVASPDYVQPSIVARDGVASLIYLRRCGAVSTSDFCASGDQPVVYRTTETAAQGPQQVLDYSRAAGLYLDKSGSAAIFAESGREPPETMSAAFASSGLTFEQVWHSQPAHSSDAWPLLLDQTADGSALAVWGCYLWEQGDSVCSATRSGGQWTETSVLIQRMLGAAAAFRAGTTHVVGIANTGTPTDGYDGYVYASIGLDGAVSGHRIASHALGPAGEFIRLGTIGLDLDPAGRPHIVYIDGHDLPASTSTWYLAGPATALP